MLRYKDICIGVIIYVTTHLWGMVRKGDGQKSESLETDTMSAIPRAGSMPTLMHSRTCVCVLIYIQIYIYIPMSYQL